jgi:hypothetical protein
MTPDPTDHSFVDDLEDLVDALTTEDLLKDPICSAYVRG